MLPAMVDYLLPACTPDCENADNAPDNSMQKSHSKILHSYLAIFKCLRTCHFQENHETKFLQQVPKSSFVLGRVYFHEPRVRHNFGNIPSNNLQKNPTSQTVVSQS